MHHPGGRRYAGWWGKWGTEELIWLCEDLYYENKRLQEKLDDLEEDLQENYMPKSKSEQYGISDSDFI